jgi:hypothetical protein
MKQIIINIQKDLEGKYTFIIKRENEVIIPAVVGDKEKVFIEDLKALIENYSK